MRGKRQYHQKRVKQQNINDFHYITSIVSTLIIIFVPQICATMWSSELISPEVENRRRKLKHDEGEGRKEDEVEDVDQPLEKERALDSILVGFGRRKCVLKWDR